MFYFLFYLYQAVHIPPRLVICHQKEPKKFLQKCQIVHFLFQYDLLILFLAFEEPFA